MSELGFNVKFAEIVAVVPSINVVSALKYDSALNVVSASNVLTPVISCVPVMLTTSDANAFEFNCSCIVFPDISFKNTNLF